MYRGSRNRGVRAILPLLPNYLLVRINVRRDRWQSLKSTRGVSDMFLVNELPSRVPDEDVQRFRDAENEMGYIVLAEHDAPRFHSNDPIHVHSGWLAGCTGIYQGLAGVSHERVKVLFSILGQPKVLEMSAFDLAAKAA